MAVGVARARARAVGFVEITSVRWLPAPWTPQPRKNADPPPAAKGFRYWFATLACGDSRATAGHGAVIDGAIIPRISVTSVVAGV